MLAATQRYDQQRRTRAERVTARLMSQLPEISSQQASTQRAVTALRACARRLQAMRVARLSSLEAQLRALSPEQTLSRGYAIVRNQKGEIVRSYLDIKLEEVLDLKLATGSASVQVQGLQKEES